MAGQGYVTKGYTTTYDEVEQPSYRGYVCNDHLCRPVIVDAEGRKKPIISYTTNHNTPGGYVTKRETIVEPVQPPEYSYSSPPKIEMFKDYGANNYKWDRQYSSSPLRDRPHVLDEFITTVHTEMSPPNYGYGHNGTKAYSDWNKPKSIGHPLTTTTNDIGEAVDFLRHAINAAPQPQVWASSPIPSGIQKRETYTETIDSSEAARRYARPVFKQHAHTYRGSIDSREALRKYNGTVVP